MSDKPEPTSGALPAACQHSVRTRDSHWGFASAETICTACGQVFDPDREQELRDRDHALRVDDPHQ